MKLTRWLTILAVTIAYGLAPHAARVQAATTPSPAALGKRVELQRHDLSVPGREVVQVKVEIGPEPIRHTHPGEEIVYVLEGSIEYRVGDDKPVTLGPGEVLFIPAGTVHSGRNVGKGVATELATYIVEKGKPLLVRVP